MAQNPGALVSVIDPEGVFVFLSPSLAQLLGFEPDEALGRNLSDFFQPAETAHFMLTIQDALLSGRSVATTRNAPLKHGGSRRMRGSMRRVVDEDSGQEYVLSVARPVE